MSQETKELSTGDRLRALAEWFDKHPKAPVPYGLSKNTSLTVSLWGEEEVKEAAHNIGSFTKEYSENYLNMVVKVADIQLVFCAERSLVCTKKVVGTRTVPATYYPEREEEIVEWDCTEPILAGGKA